MYGPRLLTFFIGILITFSLIGAEDIPQNETTLLEKSAITVVATANPPHHGTKMSRKPRILDGEVVQERDYPYMVSIMRIVRGVPTLLCGGAIIDRRHVLTAAHCVDRIRSCDLVIRTGGAIGAANYSPHLDPRTFHNVVKSFVPRQYSGVACRRHLHDIAILKVDVRMSFDLNDDKRFRKVNLPEFDGDYEGLSAIFTGYGPDYARAVANQTQGLKNNYLQYVNQLRSMQTTVISNEECQDHVDNVITDGTICARPWNPTSHSCFEDEGGPLVHEGTIIGILNDRKCNVYHPEIFTRVSYYLHFINTVLTHQSSADVLIY